MGYNKCSCSHAHEVDAALLTSSLGRWGGVGWGGLITFICTSTHTYTCHAILLYVLLHFHTDVMLRCCTFSCASTHTHVTLCSCTFSCTSTQRHFPLLYVLCIFFISRKAALFTMALLAARCVDPWSVTPKPFKWSAYAPTKKRKVSREDEAVSNLTLEERLPEVVPLAAYSCNYGT